MFQIPTKLPAKLQRFNLLFRLSLVALVLAFHFACVTVNVHFPEGAVQKATDDYVKELYKQKEKGSPPKTAPQSKQDRELDFKWLFDLAIPEAYANEEAVLKINTPKALEAKERMKLRAEEILRWKKQGLLGEALNGKLLLRQPQKTQDISDLKFKKLSKTYEENAPKLRELVENDNQDRAIVIKEFAEANQLPEVRVQESMGKSFQNHSPSGTQIQNLDGSWTPKE